MNGGVDGSFFCSGGGGGDGRGGQRGVRMYVTPHDLRETRDVKSTIGVEQDDCGC